MSDSPQLPTMIKSAPLTATGESILTNSEPFNRQIAPNPTTLDEDNMVPIDLDVEAVKAMRAVQQQVNLEVATLQATAPVTKTSSALVMTHSPHPETHSDVILPTATSIAQPTKGNNQTTIRHTIEPNVANGVADISHESVETDTAGIHQPIAPQPTQHTSFSEQPVDNSTLITVVPDHSDIEPTSFFRRLMNGLLVGLVYAVIGTIIDWVVNLAKTFSGNNSAEMVWLFMPILGLMGMVFGVLFGTRALDVIFGIFRTTPTENNPSNDDDSFSSGLFKAVGIGLLIGVIGWLLMMVML